MNPVALTHAIAAVIVVLIALPLVGRKVKRNAWYGVRIRESSVSEARWYEINEYGGRLLLYWAALMLFLAAAGLFLERPQWTVYSKISHGLIFAGLAAVVISIVRYAKKTTTAAQPEQGWHP